MTLPKIQVDSDTGKKYVIVGKKRIWLAKGVSSKDLLKFLIKLKKKGKKEKRKEKKRRKKSTEKKPVESLRFGENISRSFASPLTFPRFEVGKATVTEKIDADSVADKAAEKIKKLLEGKKDDRVAETPSQMQARIRQEVADDFQGQAMRFGNAAKVVLTTAEKKAAKAEREKEIATREAAREKKKNALEKEMRDNNDKFEEYAKETIVAAAKAMSKMKGGFKTPAQLVKWLAKEWDVPYTRAEDAYAPVLMKMMEEPYTGEKTTESLQMKHAFREAEPEKLYSKARALYKKMETQVLDLEHLKNEEIEEYNREQIDEERSSRGYLFTPPPEEPSISFPSGQMAAREPESKSESEQAEDYVISDDELDRIARADQFRENKLKQQAFKSYKEFTHEQREARMKEKEASNERLAIISEGQNEKTRMITAIKQIKEEYVKSRLEAAEAVDNAYLLDIDAQLDIAMQEVDDQTAVKLQELDAEQVQGGEGRDSSESDEGLSTNQINDLMRKYPEYLGCIGSDQIYTLRIRPRTMFGFVMNTDPSTKAGTHWVAILVDARPNGAHTIEYYNSLADKPNRVIMRDLREVAERVDAIRPLLFKVNRIPDQSDTSSNCGYFAARFLIDRFNGAPFSKASGYDKRGEARIEKWKRQLPPFTDIREEQEGDGIREVWQGAKDIVKKGYDIVKKGYQRVKDVMEGIRKHASPSVRARLNQIGDIEIVDLKICRKPIFPMIEKLANLISSGRWEENKERLSYDKMFHLYMIVRLFGRNRDEGMVLKVEKDEVVKIKDSHWETDVETESISLKVNTEMTLNRFFVSGVKTVGEEKFWVYNPVTQNCQYFIKWMLQYSGNWNYAIENFVMQDTEKVLEGLGLLGKIAKGITNTAAVADVALNGRGRRGRDGRR